MVEHAVDRSLDEREVVAVRNSQGIITRTICVAKSVCVWGSHMQMNPVGTVILPQIGELPVHLSLGEVLL